MNWKLILSLSLFGLAMAIATAFMHISNTAQWVLWFAIMIICAVVIARNAPGKYFLHGFLVSIVNSFWITVTHILLFNTFVSNNPEMAEMSAKMPMLAEHPKRLMAVVGPIYGICFGLVLGLFAFVAAKLMKRGPQVAR